MGKEVLSILIVIFLASVVGLPLLKNGLIPTHDGEYHVVRFFEFDKVLRSGVIYPRWAPDLNKGYGVPLFNFVYPLPNYVSSFLHLFGISFINSFKFGMFIAIVSGAVFFYLWSRLYWGNIGGIVSSSFYSFSPYHIVDIYIRGSVGEVWSLAFFPAFLWSITKAIRSNEKKHFVISSIFLSLIVFSHNILALIFLPFALLYILLITNLYERYKTLLPSFLTITTGLGLSSIFTIPALMETDSVRGLQIYNVSEQFPDLYQLLIPSWGSGFSESGSVNQMSFQIGIANLIAVFVGLISLKISLRKKETIFIITLFFITSFIFIFFLMLKVSHLIWEVLPLMNYFQFPWRLLSLEILIASFLAGSFIYINRSYVIALVLLIVTVGLSINYIRPAYYLNRTDDYYINRSNFIDGTNSPGNIFNTKWFNDNLEKKKGNFEGNVRILNERVESIEYTFEYASKKREKVHINTAYFPGWNAYIDNKIVPIKNNSDGLIELKTIPGKHALKVVFEDTPIRKLASLISLISLLCLIVFTIRLKYEKKT